jgi:flavin reductase (DIM6/NTAB) family NADH-FMN oxidoreductase RutF
MSQDASLPFTARDMRDALGRFPTGVAVITARAENGERLGATVSSFNSVSLDPPLVLFSIAKTAKSISLWEAVPHFAISILGDNQSEISNRFAKAMTDKWDGIDPVRARTISADLIRDALAWFECETWAKYDGGDHIIFVGKVLHLEASENANPRPLVFSGGRYRALDRAPIETPYDADTWLHGW